MIALSFQDNTPSNSIDKLVKIWVINMSPISILKFNEMVRDADLDWLLHFLDNANDMVLKLVSPLYRY